MSLIKLLATFKDLIFGYWDFIPFISPFVNLLLEIDNKISLSCGFLPTFISLIELKSTYNYWQLGGMFYNVFKLLSHKFKVIKFRKSNVF